MHVSEKSAQFLNRKF